MLTPDTCKYLAVRLNDNILSKKHCKTTYTRGYTCFIYLFICLAFHKYKGAAKLFFFFLDRLVSVIAFFHWKRITRVYGTLGLGLLEPFSSCLSNHPVGHSQTFKEPGVLGDQLPVLSNPS